MQKLVKIIHHSITLASRQPYWWLFAFLQAVIFSTVGQLARPERLRDIIVLLLILATLLLAPITIWLWQNIAVDVKALPEIKFGRNFIKLNLSGIWLVVLTVIIIILAKLVFPFWPIHTLVFALVAASSGLALLYLALCGQSLASAIRLTLYAWDKKISLVAAAALVLLLAHSIAFSLVHGVLGDFYFFREFSDFGHSATIWLMLTVLSLLIGYISAILNCFVVFLFLDIIARKKDPEKVKAKALEVARAGAI